MSNFHRHVKAFIFLECLETGVPVVLYVLFGFNLDESDPVSFFNFFLKMGKFVQHDFLFVLESVLFCLFKKFVSGHEKIILLFSDIHTSTLSFDLEDPTVRVRSFKFSIDSVVDLNKYIKLLQI